MSTWVGVWMNYGMDVTTRERWIFLFVRSMISWMGLRRTTVVRALVRPNRPDGPSFSRDLEVPLVVRGFEEGGLGQFG